MFVFVLRELSVQLKSNRNFYFQLIPMVSVVVKRKSTLKDLKPGTTNLFRKLRREESAAK